MGATIRCRGYTAASKGLKVYDYERGTQFSHLKLSVDVANDMVHYGSYNYNMRSKRHDSELNFLTRDHALALQSQSILQYDLSQSGPAKGTSYFYIDNEHVPECIAERATNWGT